MQQRGNMLPGSGERCSYNSTNESTAEFHHRQEKLPNHKREEEAKEVIFVHRSWTVRFTARSTGVRSNSGLEQRLSEGAENETQV